MMIHRDALSNALDIFTDFKDSKVPTITYYILR